MPCSRRTRCSQCYTLSHLFPGVSRGCRRTYSPRVLLTCAVAFCTLHLECAQEKHSEAVPLLERALSIRVKRLGENHADTVSTLDSLNLARGKVGELLGCLVDEHVHHLLLHPPPGRRGIYLPFVVAPHGRCDGNPEEAAFDGVHRGRFRGEPPLRGRCSRRWASETCGFCFGR